MYSMYDSRIPDSFQFIFFFTPFSDHTKFFHMFSNSLLPQKRSPSMICPLLSTYLVTLFPVNTANSRKRHVSYVSYGLFLELPQKQYLLATKDIFALFSPLLKVYSHPPCHFPRILIATPLPLGMNVSCCLATGAKGKSLTFSAFPGAPEHQKLDIDRCPN